MFQLLNLQMFKEMKSETALIQDQVIKFDKSSITLNLQRVLCVLIFAIESLNMMLTQQHHEDHVKRLEYYVTLCKPWVNSLRAHNRILQGLFTCQASPASLKSSHTARCAFPTHHSSAHLVGLCAMHEFLQVM